jgi:hypothetical protein
MRPPGIFDSAEWQMALGERAALEGLVAQLKPTLAIEIGTAEGGSLDRIAAHSRHVHTFDLDAQLRREYPNVTLHTGDSHELVPAFLEELATAGESVDFVLIDGDHTRAGVRADLENVLSSPAVSRTHIVLHDTTNPGVRAGFMDVSPDKNPKVVFSDPDLVVLHQRLSPLEEPWGGLGLVVVDASGASFPSLKRFERDPNDALRTSSTASALWQAAAPLRSVKRRVRDRLRPVRDRLRER